MRRLARRLVLVLALPLALLGLWLALALLGWPGPRLLPAPAVVASLALHELTHAALWRDVGATLARVVIGVGLASALGASLGFALGRSRRWRAASEPSVDFVRSIPPILTFPLFLLGLGYGERARTPRPCGAPIRSSVTITMTRPVASATRTPRIRPGSASGSSR